MRARRTTAGVPAAGHLGRPSRSRGIGRAGRAGGRWARLIRRWRRELWPSWVDANLRIILIARCAMSMARAIAGVVVALYLAAEGFSALKIGVLFLVVTVVSALMSTGVGLLSDRVGRKPFLVVVPLLATVAAAAFAVDRTPALLFVFAALGSFGRGQGAGGGTVGPYQPAESAFVAEGVPASVRTAAFGRLAFVSSLGALFGSLLAGLAHTHPHMTPAAAATAYRPAFVAAGVLAAVAAVVALWLHEPQRERAASPGHRDRRPRMSWPRQSWPALWRLSVTNSVNGLGIGLFGPFVSYWLARRYGASPAAIGLLFALVNLGSLVSTLAAAGIGRRLGTVRAIVAVRAIGGVLMVPMALAPTFWIAGVVFFVRMLAQRVGMPLRQSFTQDLAHPEERASVAALSNLPAQGTMGAGQVLAGFLFDEVGLAAPFELAAVFQCANAVLYGILFGWAKPSPRDKRGDSATSDNTDPGAAGGEASGRATGGGGGGGMHRDLSFGAGVSSTTS
ncbi:MAG: MFS transporter [Acidimicrobiales bacterium]